MLHANDTFVNFTSQAFCVPSGMSKDNTCVLISPQPDPTERQLKGRHFFVRRGGHCCRGNLVNGQPSELFLSGLQKLEFGRCSLFPSWSG